MDSLVISQTRTQHGHRFYQQFSALWRRLDGSTLNDTMVTVREDRFNGNTLITILANGRQQAKFILPRGEAKMEAYAQGAVSAVFQQLQREHLLNHGNDADLAPSGY